MCRVPARTMPVPTGAPPDRLLGLLPGTFALLFSCTLLCSKTVQPVAPLTGGDEPLGHAPSCGAGWSSLFCEFAVRPVLLWSNSVFLMTKLPPALVPEKPSALVSPREFSSTWSQFGHAPM